jgi:hypothetical protein
MAMIPRLLTLNGLAVETGIDRRMVATRLRGTKPDGKISGRDAWYLRTFINVGGLGTNERSNASDGDRRHPLLESAIERLDSWREIYAEPAPEFPIDEVARLLGVEPEAILTWLRCGAPHVLEGDFRTGKGFTLRVAAIIDWAVTLSFICHVVDDDDARRRLMLKGLGHGSVDRSAPSRSSTSRER